MKAIDTDLNYRSTVRGSDGGVLHSLEEVVLSDPAHGREKMAAYLKLGFTWEGRQGKTPKWSELYHRYMKALDEINIPLESRIRPALVFVRSDKADSTKREYRLVDPYRDPIPDSSEGFELLSPYVQFNIPFSAVIANLRQGKWPLMDGIHDVGHFVGFMRYPEFAAQVLASVRKIPQSGLVQLILNSKWLARLT